MTGPLDDRAVRYLLDELAEPDRDAFEDEYFGDEDGYGALLAAEDDLIDRYCDGTLDEGRRARFEQRYLTTAEGRERVEFARTLKRRAAAPRDGRAASDPMRPPRAARSWLPWAAVLVVGLGALALATLQTADARRARRERAAALERMAQQQQRTREQDRRLSEMRERLARLQEQARAMEELLGGVAPGLRTMSIALASGLRRDAAALQRLVLAPDIAVVRLNLLVEGAPRPAYRAALQTPEGRELWSRDGLAASPSGATSGVIFTVPAPLLAPGHYVVMLGPSRAESDAEYVFEVRRAR
jgi:hypothetical protein